MKTAIFLIAISTVISGCSTIKEANKQYLQTNSGREIIVSQFKPGPELHCSLITSKECHLGLVEANFDLQGALGVCIKKLSPYADELDTDYIYFNLVSSSGFAGFRFDHQKRMGHYYRCKN